jgi:uncharacterized YccA/Bax inhibitor family protein
MFEGIFFQAAVMTLAVLFTVLFLYRSGIELKPNTQTGVLLATGTVALLYLLSMLPVPFGTSELEVISSPQLDRVLRLVIVGIAALNLLLDIRIFEENRQQKAGWFPGISLLLVLAWLYIEILSLESLYSSGF